MWQHVAAARILFSLTVREQAYKLRNSNENIAELTTYPNFEHSSTCSIHQTIYHAIFCSYWLSSSADQSGIGCLSLHDRKEIVEPSHVI